MEYCMVIRQDVKSPQEDIRVILSYETPKICIDDFFRTHVRDYRSPNQIVEDLGSVIPPLRITKSDDGVCMEYSTEKDNLVMTLLRYFNLSHPSQQMIQ